MASLEMLLQKILSSVGSFLRRQLKTNKHCLGQDTKEVLVSTSVTSEQRMTCKDILEKFNQFFKVRKNTIFGLIAVISKRMSLQNST